MLKNKERIKSNIMLKNILTLLFITSYIYASEEKYTISVCVTSNLENALVCKKRIFDKMQGDVFIVKDKKEKFHTYLNIYSNKEEALIAIKSTSSYVKKQKPYVKLLENEVLFSKSKNKIFIDLNNPIKPIVETIVVKKENIADIKEEKKEEKKKFKEEFPLVSVVPNMEELKLVGSYPFPEGKKFVDDDVIIEEKPEIKEEPIQKEVVLEEKNDVSEKTPYEEEIRQISMDEFDKAYEEEEKKVQKITKSYEKIKPVKKEIKKVSLPKKEKEEVDYSSNVLDYQQLIIEVDSVTNYMTVKAQINDHLQKIKTYRVSTGKKDVKKPFGVGKISQISLNPVWYPTADTIKSFRKRGIYLPSVVPPGDKYNYMGAAKINLTHIVDGKNTFRIHGTLNEKTIGTNESAGCIRMKNSDVLQLANLINDFASMKSMDKVKVVLK